MNTETTVTDSSKQSTPTNTVWANMILLSTFYNKTFNRIRYKNKKVTIPSQMVNYWY